MRVSDAAAALLCCNPELLATTKFPATEFVSRMDGRKVLLVVLLRDMYVTGSISSVLCLL